MKRRGRIVRRRASVLGAPRRSGPQAYFRPNAKGRDRLNKGKRLERRAPEFGTWWLKYRDAAGQVTRERSVARTQAEADRLAHEKAHRAERVRGGLEDALHVVSCEALFKGYLDAHMHLASQGPMRSQVRRWFAPHFGRKPSAEVTPADCAALLEKARRAGQKPTTVRQLLVRGRLVFEWGRKHLRCCLANPWDDVERVSVPRQSVVYLSQDAVDAILQAAGPQRFLLLLAVLTGARRGELGGLLWEDFTTTLTPEGPVQVVRLWKSWQRDTTKGGTAREVPLHPALLPELEAARARATSEYVFPAPRGGKRTKKGGMRNPDAWHTARLLRNVARRAGVALPARCTFHSLRKTFITALLHSGSSLSDAQKLAGHSTPHVTATYYAGTEVGHLARAVGRLRLVPAIQHAGDTRAPSAAAAPTPKRKKD